MSPSPHWIPQSRPLLPDVFQYTTIGRFERFTDDFTAILARLDAPREILTLNAEVTNPTRPLSLAAVFNTALAGRVFDFYREDFERFGYDRESWRTTAA